MSLDILNPSLIDSGQIGMTGNPVGWYKDNSGNIYVVEQEGYAPIYTFREDSHVYSRMKSIKEKPVFDGITEELFLKTIAVMKSDVKVNDIDL